MMKKCTRKKRYRKISYCRNMRYSSYQPHIVAELNCGLALLDWFV